jgi:phosphorylcholine metabolism protein LicD
MKVELFSLSLLLLSVLQTVHGIMFKYPVYRLRKPIFTLTPSNHIVDMTYNSEEMMKSSSKKKSFSIIPSYITSSLSSFFQDCRSYLSLVRSSSLSCIRSELLLKKLQYSSFSRDPVIAGLTVELEKVHNAKFKRFLSYSPLYYGSQEFLNKAIVSLQSTSARLKQEYSDFPALLEKMKEESFGTVKEIKKSIKVVRQSKSFDQFLAYSYYEWLSFPHKKTVLIPTVLFFGTKVYGLRNEVTLDKLSRMSVP